MASSAIARRSHIVKVQDAIGEQLGEILNVI